MFVLWHKCDYIKLVNIIRKMIKLTFILLLLEFCLNSCPSEGVDYSDSLITNGDF